MAMLRVALTTTLLATALGASLVGTKVPAGIDLDFGFPPEKIDLSKRVAGKRVIVVGLPGAFTPTWSTQQVPGYLDEQKTLKSLGVDEVIIYCVNDGAVMDAWADVQGVDQKAGFIKMMGDPSGSLTRALGMVLNHPGPMSKLGYERCKRFALYIVDGTVKIERVAEAEDDPAGDDKPDVTLAPAMAEAIKALGKDEL